MFLVCTQFKCNRWVCPVFTLSGPNWSLQFSTFSWRKSLLYQSKSVHFHYPWSEKHLGHKELACHSLTTDSHSQTTGFAVSSLVQLLGILWPIPVLRFYVLIWYVEWSCRQAVYDKGSHSAFQIVTVPRIHFPDSWFSMQRLITQYLPSMSYAH